MYSTYISFNTTSQDLPDTCLCTHPLAIYSLRSYAYTISGKFSMLSYTCTITCMYTSYAHSRLNQASSEHTHIRSFIKYIVMYIYVYKNFICNLQEIKSHNVQLTEEIMDCQSRLDMNKIKTGELEKQLNSIITKYPEMKQKVRNYLRT